MSIQLKNKSSALTLTLRDSANFPYRRFAESRLPNLSIKKMASLICYARNLYSEYQLSSGLIRGQNNTSDFVDEATYNQLFALMEQFIEYTKIFRLNADESTLNSVKVTLNKLEDLLRQFEMHSVSEILKFVNKMQRILSTYHRSTDLTLYVPDLSGTYDPSDKAEPIIAFTNQQQALDLIETEGEDDSRLYEIFANVISRGDKSSTLIEEGQWKVNPNDVFNCVICATY